MSTLNWFVIMKKQYIGIIIAVAIEFFLLADYFFAQDFINTTQLIHPAGRFVDDDKLSSYDATAITQDTLQTMWIGTSDGLNIVEGSRYTQLFHSDSDSTTIPSSTINCLHKDKTGKIWVGTKDGVALYTGAYKFKTFRLPSGNNIQQIGDTQDSAILVTNGKAAYKIKKGHVRIFHAFHKHHPCNFIFCDRQGGFWSVSPNDIVRYDYRHRPIYEKLEQRHKNLAYYYQQGDTVWISQGQDLTGIDLRADRIFFRTSKPLPILPSVIYAVDKGNILINSAYHGLYSFHPDNAQLVKVQEGEGALYHKDVTISTFFEDSNHNTWIGFKNGGFQFIPRHHVWLNRTYGKLVSSTQGRSIGRLNIFGNLLLGVTEEGMFSYDIKKGLFRDYYYYDTFNDSPTYRQTVTDFVPYGKDGKGWIITNVRIFSCLATDSRISIISRAFGNDNVGPLLGNGVCMGNNVLVTSSSPYLIKCAFGSTRPDSIYVRDNAYGLDAQLAEMKNGKVIVVMKGLRIAVYDRGAKQCEPYAAIGKDTGNGIIPSSVDVDSKGTIWIGTLRDGLYKIHSGSRVVKKDNTFVADHIISVKSIGKDRLLVATPTGIIDYNVHTGAQVYNTFNMPYDGDHLQEIVQDCHSVGKQVFYSSSNGIRISNLVDDTSLTTIPNFARIGFSYRRNGWKMVEGGIKNGDRFILPNNTNGIRISFRNGSPNRHNSQMYQCVLIGLNEGWSKPLPLEELTYTDLRPGHYTLKIRVADRNSSHAEQTLSFTILPTFWLSAPAIYLYIAVASIIILLFNRLFLRTKANQLQLYNLRRSHERDEQTNKMNMSFFTNISHEFRNPLTIIAGPLTALRSDSRLPEAERKTINMVCRSVNRMLRMIDQMLDFNQLETDVLKLKVGEYDIANETLAITEECNESAKLRNIKVTTEGLKDNIYGWIDNDKYEKILSNLLTNALKHCPDKGNISVSLSCTDECIFVKVTNSGKPIPKDSLKDVFKRYYQVKGDLTEMKYTWGSGLGLYYVKRMVELLHGSIQAYNEPDGKSVTFSLSIPIRKDMYKEADIAPANQAQTLILDNGIKDVDEKADRLKDEVNRAGGKPKILVIDDDIDVAQYIRSLFINDYVVVNKYNAMSALLDLEEINPDIILTDIVMEEDMSGLELCDKIKQNVMLSHIPVIIITAKSTTSEQIKGLHTGAVAYVTKPFDPDYLRALVQSQLNNIHALRTALSAAVAGQNLPKGISEQDRKFIEDLYSLMEKHLSEQDLNVGSICRDFLISRSKFNKKLKELTGETPASLFRKYKLNKAAQMLKQGKYNVSEIAMLTGFGTISYFSVAFKKMFGVPPSEYK